MITFAERVARQRRKAWAWGEPSTMPLLSDADLRAMGAVATDPARIPPGAAYRWCSCHDGVLCPDHTVLPTRVYGEGYR